ncbi:SUZ domain-containing protein 1 isoform X2 [Pongo abelii]|uniref:SUZ domain-containing protein 1 isoform X2 n=1 Tax=Pongo abelii TaxID=9601 RepID=UPI0023E7D5F2|nr:SUZ domain-containing protein 1 isoform X2 [Pongo abelii]
MEVKVHIVKLENSVHCHKNTDLVSSALGLALSAKACWPSLGRASALWCPAAPSLPQEIDRRLEKKLKITQKERKSKSPPKVPIVIQDDSLPAGPPPQIRILKRPTSNGVVSSPNSTSRPTLPVKSLAQREAEYAEARKRILGSASPEEEQEKPILDRPTRISQPEDSRQPNNVIRQPLGPDGSQGFKQRR